MKVKIKIEQFDNGISLSWENDGVVEKKVAYESDSKRVIGEMILEDIKHIMDSTSTNKVIMEIDYKVEDDERD